MGMGMGHCSFFIIAQSNLGTQFLRNGGAEKRRWRCNWFFGLPPEATSQHFGNGSLTVGFLSGFLGFGGFAGLLAT